MRYKHFAQIFSTAALAGALTLSAAPQVDNPEYQDEEQTYTTQQTSNTTQSTTVDQQTTAVETKAAMSNGRIERKIQKAISRDVTMSNRALDIRIIAKDGVVTLKGSVPTTMEKSKIVEKASELVGSTNVVDNLKVKHPNYLG